MELRGREITIVTSRFALFFFEFKRMNLLVEDVVDVNSYINAFKFLIRIFVVK